MAEPEIVGQHFFNFGIRSVRGVFSGSERRYEITGIYATGHDSNYEPPYDPSKRSVHASFDWVADGRYNPGTKAIYEKLDFFPDAGSSVRRFAYLNDALRPGSMVGGTGPVPSHRDYAGGDPAGRIRRRYERGRAVRAVFLGAHHRRTCRAEPSIRHCARGTPKSRTCITEHV